MNKAYHIPVLLQACTEGMNVRPGGTYVDATFGGGGHSRALLGLMDGGRLIAFDKDPDAQVNNIKDERFTLVAQDFRYMRNNLRMMGAEHVDGILADLGVSSHQFDEAKRGFSIRHDGPLDMRMDGRLERSAADLLGSVEEKELSDIFYQYGELKNARSIARRIVQWVAEKPMSRTGELKECVLPLAPKGKENRYLARVFQALRIAVNDEMAALRELLEQSAKLIRPGGRLVVISYHSLEDRLVKFYIRAGNWSGQPEKDLYGNPLVPFKAVNLPGWQVGRKPIVPTKQEVQQNERARSAKLRIAERCLERS